MNVLWDFFKTSKTKVVLEVYINHAHFLELLNSLRSICLLVMSTEVFKTLEKDIFEFKYVMNMNQIIKSLWIFRGVMAAVWISLKTV